MQTILTDISHILLVLGFIFFAIAMYFFIKFRLWATVDALTDTNGQRRSKRALKKMEKAKQRNKEKKKGSEVLGREKSGERDEVDAPTDKTKAQSKHSSTTKLKRSANEENKTTMLRQNHLQDTDNKSVNGTNIAATGPSENEGATTNDFIITRKIVRTFDRKETQ